ncbi:MAG TPA: DUF3060 domain-containing protein [Kofleriaceae bacterium]|nr:DUF3060 domain-containing protein [Kofleriaceae bacterium]
MKKITLHAAALALALTATAARADVSIIDNNQKITVDCAKDRMVNIVGNKATVTLKGTCEGVNISGNKASVTGSATLVNVSGNDNTVDLDAADGVNVSGNDNTVSYRKPVKAKSTRVTNSGNGNKISRTK